MALSHDELFEIYILSFTSKSHLQIHVHQQAILKLPKRNIFCIEASTELIAKGWHMFLHSARHHSVIQCPSWIAPFTWGGALIWGVPQTTLGFLSNSAKILSSSNGLILCRTTGENEVKLFITNPVTQSLLPIPIPDEYKQKSIISIDAADLKIGFECDGKDDYIVYLFYDNLVDWSSSNLDCKV